MLIFLINLIATKQSHIHDAITKRLLRQQDHLLKIKFPHVPRNDAAVVRFVLGRIAAIVGVYDAVKLKFQEPSINKF